MYHRNISLKLFSYLAAVSVSLRSRYDAATAALFWGAITAASAASMAAFDSAIASFVASQTRADRWHDVGSDEDLECAPT